MNYYLMHHDEFDADADDLASMNEIEYEESDDIETAVEVELLLSRVLATRFLGA